MAASVIAWNECPSNHSILRTRAGEGADGARRRSSALDGQKSNEMTTDELRVMFAHMQKVSAVMFDRSMWHAPIYKALSADGFKGLSLTEPELARCRSELEEPVRYALGYAQIALVGTAIELTLLHLYVNSFVIFTENGDISTLRELKSRIDSSSRSPNFDQFCALDPEAQMKHLKKLSFTNISEVEKLFSDIYGANCLEIAWTPSVYREIRDQASNLYTRRNGILHRGGETADGVMISITKDDLSSGFADIWRMATRFKALSQYFLVHWIKKAGN